MANVLIHQFKESIPLFRFVFGTNTVTATTWKSPVVWKGVTYKPEPGIECKIPKQGSGLSEEEATIEIPTLRSQVHPELSSMATLMAQPRSFPPTKVTVMNLLRSGSDSKMLYLYEGKLEKLTRNPDGKKSVVRLSLRSELSAGLDRISLGRRCDPECDVVFGAAGCWVNNFLFYAAVPTPPPYVPQEVRRAKVILSPSGLVNSREVTLTLDTTAPEHAALAGNPSAQNCITQRSVDWWVRSYLEKDGLRITVHQWKQGTSMFVLNRIPPKSWEESRVTLVPDCQRTLAACTERGNAANFGGLGLLIPAYNPTLEQS